MEMTTRRLTSTQARRLCEKIVSQATDLRALLLELRDGKGWLALGYSSWAECCETEFGYSKRHANRLIECGKICEQLGPMGPAMTERQARELGKVPEEQREAVVEAAKAEAGDKPLTARAIREAADRILDDGEEADVEPITPEVEQDEPAPAPTRDDSSRERNRYLSESLVELVEQAKERSLGYGEFAADLLDAVSVYSRERSESSEWTVYENLAAKLRRTHA